MATEMNHLKTHNFDSTIFSPISHFKRFSVKRNYTETKKPGHQIRNFTEFLENFPLNICIYRNDI